MQRHKGRVVHVTWPPPGAAHHGDDRCSLSARETIKCNHFVDPDTCPLSLSCVGGQSAGYLRTWNQEGQNEGLGFVNDLWLVSSQGLL